MSDVKQRPIANSVNNDDWIVVQSDDAGLGDEKRVRKSQLAGGVFPDLASFNAAGGAAAYGDGPVWIGGVQYIVRSNTLIDLNDNNDNVVNIPADVPAPILNADFTYALNLSSPVAGKSIAFTRASVAWYTNADGVYKQHASGVPGFGKHGIIVEPARTNVCTNHNAAPNTGVNITASGGTLSAVTEFDAIADAGLAEIVPTGQVYQLTNTSGSTQTVTFGGQLGNTNRCAFGVWARSFGAESTLQTSGGAGAVRIPVGKKLQRVVSERVTPSAATNQLQISVPNNSTVQFILNQFESFTSATYATALTSPIVVAGASATRAATLLTIPIINNDIVPRNDFTLYAEVTPASWVESLSLSDGPALVSIHQASPLRGLKPRGLGIRKQIGAEETPIDVNVRSRISACWRRGTNKLVVRQSATGGVSSYFNGAVGINNGITSNFSLTNIDIANGVLVIGNQDNSVATHFHGEIKYVRVYNSVLTDEQSSALTLANENILDVGNYGPAFIDPRQRNRLWALRYNVATNLYDTICYSDNFGLSWTGIYTLQTPTGNATLTIDNAGNFYYLHPGTSQLMRLTADLSTVSIAVTFFSDKGPVSGWSWLPWHFAVDMSGNIYTAGYGFQNTELKVWYSTDNGATFTVYNTIKDQINSPSEYRHFHSIKVNPWTNQLFLAYGDGSRGTIRSKATTGNLLQPGQPFATAWDTVTDSVTPGPTGITFMSDGAYFSSDNVGNANNISFVPNLTAQLLTDIQEPYRLMPLYYISSKGSRYLIAVTYHESTTPPAGINTRSALHVLARDYVGGPWYVKKIIALEDVLDTGADYFEISSDSHSIIDYDPDYVFVCAKTRANNQRRLLRIAL